VPSTEATLVPGACPRPLLPVLNACPPCSPTGCYCADGRLLTLEDQAKAFEVWSAQSSWKRSYSCHF
jgi:hypothetical protein